MKRRSDTDDRSENTRQEVECNPTFEKITYCKEALSKVICCEWRSKLRNAVNTITQIQVHGTRAFLYYILYTVIEKGFEIKSSDKLATIVRG